MVEIKSQPTYFVAFLKTRFTSIDEVKAKMPDALATHLSRSNELHRHGKVLDGWSVQEQPRRVCHEPWLCSIREKTLKST